jgi:hypothetical protein
MAQEVNGNAAANSGPLDELINMLGDADPQVRAQGRRLLCARTQEAIPRLVKAMEVAAEDVRFEISKALTEMGEEALGPMMEAIRHPNAHVRAIAARVLSLTGGQDARNRLDEMARREERKTVRKELREAAAMISRRLESVAARQATHPPREGAEPHKPAGLSEKEQQQKKLYLSIVRDLILSNWTVPHRALPESDAEEILVTLKVDRDGGVFRVLIENKWQNSPLGESLKDAVRRSAPFPHVPEVVARGKPEIDITFILPLPS